MGYEYKGPTSRPRRRDTHNQANKFTRASKRRDLLLDKGKENYFRYDMEDLLAQYKVEENRRASLAQSVFTKGSRGGIEEAKEFTKEKLDEGIIDEPTYKSILRLIDKYTRYR